MDLTFQASVLPVPFTASRPEQPVRRGRPSRRGTERRSECKAVLCVFQRSEKRLCLSSLLGAGSRRREEGVPNVGVGGRYGCIISRINSSLEIDKNSTLIVTNH